MDRRSDYKFHGLTTDELRRRREETTIQLRQSRREEALQKRRFMTPGTADTISEFPSMDLQQENHYSMLDSTTAEGMVPSELLQGLHSTDLQTLSHAATGLRRMLSKERDPPIQSVINAGVVPRLVNLLKLAFYGDRSVQYDLANLSDEQQGTLKEKVVFEVAWALTNVASGKPEQTLIVVQSEAPSLFMKLLDHPNSDICEQSIWALGNIAGDGPAHRDLLLSMGMASKLQTLLEGEMDKPTPHMALIRNSTWAMSNLARGKPPTRYDLLKPLLPTLARLIQCQDSDTLCDAGWTLSYMTDASYTGLFADFKALGMIPTMVHNLETRHHYLQAPYLRAVGNLVTGDDADTQEVLDANLLPNLFMMLTTSPKASIQKECCWVISNITAGTSSQIQLVIDASLIPLLISNLRTGDSKIKKEAAWALCNATSHPEEPNQIRYLVSNGLLKPLSEYLKREVKEVRLILVILDAIDNILTVGSSNPLSILGVGDVDREYADQLEEYGAVDVIDSLQRHESDHVYSKAKSIIDKYFGGAETQNNNPDEDNDEIMLEQQQQQQVPTSNMQSIIPEGGFSF